MSSVNAPGLQYGSMPPRFDYFPLDEKHPFYPDDAVCGQVVLVAPALL